MRISCTDKFYGSSQDYKNLFYLLITPCVHNARLSHGFAGFSGFFLSFLPSNVRLMYIKKYWIKPSMFKLVKLLSVHNKKQMCNFAKFLKYALFKRSQN